jgi:phage shock protein E
MKRLIFGVLMTLFGTKAMAEQSKIVILDVRTKEEFQESHVIGAQNIDWYNPDFKDLVSKLDKDAVYKLYCRSGNRSGQATTLMQALGFKTVENLGSVAEASQKLKIACQGPKAC